MKTATGEFLRDFRRENHWQKTEAHRKKVLMKSRKKDLEANIVKIDTIRQDPSTNKESSHVMLKSMIVKHPRVFHESRLYTNKDLELLLRGYGISKKGKKEILADRLIQAIKENHFKTDRDNYSR